MFSPLYYTEAGTQRCLTEPLEMQSCNQGKCLSRSEVIDIKGGPINTKKESCHANFCVKKKKRFRIDRYASLRWDLSAHEKHQIQWHLTTSKNVFLVRGKRKWINWKPYKILPKQLCKFHWLKQSLTNALSSVFSKESAVLFWEIRRKQNKAFLRLSDYMVIGRFSRRNNGQ